MKYKMDYIIYLLLNWCGYIVVSQKTIIFDNVLCYIRSIYY